MAIRVKGNSNHDLDGSNQYIDSLRDENVESKQLFEDDSGIHVSGHDNGSAAAEVSFIDKHISTAGYNTTDAESD